MIPAKERSLNRTFDAREALAPTSDNVCYVRLDPMFFPQKTRFSTFADCARKNRFGRLDLSERFTLAYIVRTHC